MGGKRLKSDIDKTSVTFSVRPQSVVMVDGRDPMQKNQTDSHWSKVD